MTYNINDFGKAMYMMVPVDDLLPNRFMPRSGSNLHLDELKRSIETFGIIHPIITHRVGDKFEIISGQRRSIAASIAGFSKIPAIVYNHIEDSILILLFSCIENIEREALYMSDIMDSITILKQNCVPDEITLDVFFKTLPVNSNKN